MFGAASAVLRSGKSCFTGFSFGKVASTVFPFGNFFPTVFALKKQLQQFFTKKLLFLNILKISRVKRDG